MPIVRTADGRYFDVPENILSRFKLNNNQLPLYITSPNEWIIDPHHDVEREREDSATKFSDNSHIK